MKALKNRIDRNARYANRQFGTKAKFIRKGAFSVDLETGVQSSSDQVTTVWLRAWPLSARELSDRSNAGLEQVDTRWSMRTGYIGEVRAGDLLTVDGFTYEIVPNGATKDEFSVEWTIMTRRRR